MQRIHVKELSEPALQFFHGKSEAELLHYYEPGQGVFIAESPNVTERALQAGYQPVVVLMEEKSMTEQVESMFSSYPELPVFMAQESVLKELTGYPMSRGLLCVMRRRVLPSVEKICDTAERIVVLDHVMNPTNVGAIFRSAAALNMDAILLTPGSSDPLYRRAARVSMGTVFQIPWTYLENQANGVAASTSGIERLKRLGFSVAAMALNDNSLAIDDPVLQSQDRLAIVMGTEGDGLAAETIKACDYTVKIPMAHGVDSLNVAAAGAVAFWQLRKRFR